VPPNGKCIYGFLFIIIAATFFKKKLYGGTFEMNKVLTKLYFFHLPPSSTRLHRQRLWERVYGGE